MEQNTCTPTKLCSAKSIVHKSVDLEAIFYDTFYATLKTRLVGGADEPLYLPAGVAVNKTKESQLQYREDFYASALHETAHWCIAGEQRLKRIDFGYWYIPDGRNADQQAMFELVESKSQALEWLFSIAAKYTFNISLDNLSLEDQTNQLNNKTSTVALNERFKQAVHAQAIYYMESGIPVRARQFIQALSHFYQTDISNAAYLRCLMT